jgi:hypothetical protein
MVSTTPLGWRPTPWGSEDVFALCRFVIFWAAPSVLHGAVRNRSNQSFEWTRWWSIENLSTSRLPVSVASPESCRGG